MGATAKKKFGSMRLYAPLENVPLEKEIVIGTTNARMDWCVETIIVTGTNIRAEAGTAIVAKTQKKISILANGGSGLSGAFAASYVEEARNKGKGYARTGCSETIVTKESQLIRETAMKMNAILPNGGSGLSGAFAASYVEARNKGKGYARTGCSETIVTKESQLIRETAMKMNARMPEKRQMRYG